MISKLKNNLSTIFLLIISIFFTGLTLFYNTKNINDFINTIWMNKYMLIMGASFIAYFLYNIKEKRKYDKQFNIYIALLLIIRNLYCLLFGVREISLILFIFILLVSIQLLKQFKEKEKKLLAIISIIIYIIFLYFNTKTMRYFILNEGLDINWLPNIIEYISGFILINFIYKKNLIRVNE